MSKGHSPSFFSVQQSYSLKISEHLPDLLQGAKFIPRSLDLIKAPEMRRDEAVMVPPFCPLWRFLLPVPFPCSSLFVSVNTLPDLRTLSKARPCLKFPWWSKKDSGRFTFSGAVFLVGTTLLGTWAGRDNCQDSIRAWLCPLTASHHNPTWTHKKYICASEIFY